MMKNNTGLAELLERISGGQASEEDIREYNRWCHSLQGKEVPVPDFNDLSPEILSAIKKQIHPGAGRYPLKFWIKIAAAVLVLVSALGGYYLRTSHDLSRTARYQHDDVAPGGNKATLTLANGHTIILDAMSTGDVADQGSSLIKKEDSGLVVYQKAAAGMKGRPSVDRQAPTAFNTLSVPRGGQYRLILPDGTKIWLNSASSVRYPVAFTGDMRKVIITGEVYLEVAKDAGRPFVVATRSAEITVLGTSFNINAYDDEPAVNTTLVEGSVKVSLSGNLGQAILKPGEQASVGNGKTTIGIKKINVDNVIAWVHGHLSLEDCSITEFMNQLSRWYNVDVEYAGEKPQQRFGGMINRNASLSDVLSALSAGGIHTRLEGRKIIVLSR